MRQLNLLIPPFAMSIKIKTIAMPISERQNKRKQFEFALIRHTEIL